MKKNTEKKEVELADATMFDMLSKKIIASFFRHSLFCRLAVIDWEGQIRGQGDAVLMRDHTKVLVEHAIPIEEERDPAIFKDTTMINMVSKRIAMELRDKVEAEIIKEDDEMALTHDYEILAGTDASEIRTRQALFCRWDSSGGRLRTKRLRNEIRIRI